MVTTVDTPTLEIAQQDFEHWLRSANPNRTIGECTYDQDPLVKYMREAFPNGVGYNSLYIRQGALVISTYTCIGWDNVEGADDWRYVDKTVSLPVWARNYLENLQAWFGTDEKLSPAQTLRALRIPQIEEKPPHYKVVVYKAIQAASPCGASRQEWTTILHQVERLLLSEVPHLLPQARGATLPSVWGNMEYLEIWAQYEIRTYWPQWRRILPLRVVALLEPTRHEQEFWNAIAPLW